MIKSKQSFFCCLVVLFLGSKFLTSQNIRAQESPEPSQTPLQSTPTPEVDFQTYLNTLEKYRTSEQQFGIAKQQYFQLGTLAALEQATQRSLKAQIDRNSVLDLYFQLLKSRFAQTAGIELREKKLEIDRMEFILDFLSTQKASLEKASTYQQLDKFNAELKETQESINTVAYETLILKKIGELQTVLDHLTSISAKVYDAVEKTPEKERGYAEITKTLKEADTSLNKTIRSYLEEIDSAPSDADIYQEIIEALNDPYMKIKQAFKYLQELES